MCEKNEEIYSRLLTIKKLPNYEMISYPNNDEMLNIENYLVDEGDILSPDPTSLISIYTYSHRKLREMVKNSLEQALLSKSISELNDIIPMEVYGDWEHILLKKWDINGKLYSLRACLWDDEFGVYDNPIEGYNSENIHTHGYHMITYGLVGSGYTSEYFDFNDTDTPTLVALTSLEKGQIHAMASKLYHRVYKPRTPSISLNITVSTKHTKKDYIEYSLKRREYFKPNRYISTERERVIRAYRKLVRYSYLLGQTEYKKAHRSPLQEIKEEAKTIENYVK